MISEHLILLLQVHINIINSQTVSCIPTERKIRFDICTYTLHYNNTIIIRVQYTFELFLQRLTIVLLILLSRNCNFGLFFL